MSIIQEDHDIIHQVIFRLQNLNVELKFPIKRISDYLTQQGYIQDYRSTSRVIIVLYKDGKKVTVTEAAICFEELDSSTKEKYKQKFYSYIISRSKIFFESALQNNKASKINLIQSQLRTCVSNMYYTLHNSLASMVEYYKTEHLTNEEIRENWGNNDDEETMLGHFIPDALKVFINNIDFIINSEKEECLQNDIMKCGKLKSYQNPFSWLYPIFCDSLEQAEFQTIVESMAEILKKISMENIGVDETQRRSAFEKHLKESLEEIQLFLNRDTLEREKYYLLTISGFFGYAYMLRQLGDYDSLFDMKTSKRDIINWTIITSNFVSYVINYLNENNNETINRIEKLDAISSPEIISLGDLDTDMMAMTLTGIIIEYDFNFVNVIKNLYSRHGYTVLDHKGIVSSFTNESNEITMYKTIDMAPLECYITISNQGIFRIDIRVVGRKYMSFKEAINHHYLEKYVEYDILEKNLMVSVSERALLVRGIPTTYGNHINLNYIELLTGIHPFVDQQIRFRLRRKLDEFDKNTSEEGVLTRSYFSLDFNEDVLNARVKYFLRNREELSNLKINSVLLIVFSTRSIINNMDEVITGVKCDFNEKIPNISFNIEQVFLSESDIKQILVQKDYSKLEFNIIELKKKYYTPQDTVLVKEEKLENGDINGEEILVEEEVS